MDGWVDGSSLVGHTFQNRIRKVWCPQHNNLVPFPTIQVYCKLVLTVLAFFGKIECTKTSMGHTIHSYC